MTVRREQRGQAAGGELDVVGMRSEEYRVHGASQVQQQVLVGSAREPLRLLRRQVRQLGRHRDPALRH